MRYLTTDEVMLIHERILEKSEGAGGIIEWKLLASAVKRPQASFDKNDLYSNLFVKAAALGHSLVLNHPFIDGNKRTAWEAMHTFIEENGFMLKVKPDEIVELMLRVEDKSAGVEQIATWLKQRAKRE